jgi:hypothetical protein
VICPASADCTGYYHRTLQKDAPESRHLRDFVATNIRSTMRKRGYGLFILLLTGCASKPPEQPATSTGADTGVGTIVRLDPALDELVPPFGEDRETGWWIPVHRGTALVSGWLSLVQRCDRERRTAVESGWQGHRDLAARWRRKQRSAGGFVHRTKRYDCGRMARCCSASTATGRSLELPKIARFRCFSTPRGQTIQQSE